MSESEQPDPRGDRRGDLRARHDPLHEGHPRRAGLRLLRAHGRRCSRRSTRASPRSTSSPTPASARSSRRSRSGRRSPSCSARRAGRRLRHRHRDVRERRARRGARRCPTVSRRPLQIENPSAAEPAAAPASRPVENRLGMRPVAVVTDSTHYTPARADAAARHPQVSLYVGWRRSARPRERDESFDAFYERLRDEPRAADHLAALDRRLPRRLGAAARRRAATSSRSTSPEGSPARVESARQAQGAARRARAGRAGWR